MKQLATSLIKMNTRYHKRWIVSFLLAVLLVVGFGVLTHQDDHPLADDVNCQFCLSSFSHTPVTLGTELIIAEIKQHFSAELENSEAQIQTTTLFTVIRAPPF